jgi:threonine aldolase
MPRYLSQRTDENVRQALARITQAAVDDDARDAYGSGRLIGTFEAEVAALLGKERAVFAMSGKAAQLAMLRVHAERRGRMRISAHPRSHIVEDENDAVGTLYGLAVARTGTLTRFTTVDDLSAIREPLGAVVIELPLRRLAYAAPPWETLVALADRARSLGAAVHLDGARLWEVQPYYGRSHAEIAALFDTVYVSFYKGLGAPAGAALAGSADDVEAARIWIVRAGAIVHQMYPMVVAARAGVRDELPRMHAYYEKARAFADAFADVDGLDVVPAEPFCNGFAVHVRGAHDALLRAADAVAAERDLVVLRSLQPTANDRVQTTEIVVTGASLAIDPGEARAAFAEILARANA